jgi:hypothetical protein
MRVFLISCAAAVAIAIGAAGVLQFVQEPADVAYKTTGVRL